MARKTGSTISQEELYPLADEPARPDLDDARLLDLDVEQESAFLRGQKRVSVRRGPFPKKTATRLTWIAVASSIAFLCAMATAALYHYGERSWRFRVNSSDDLEIAGLQNVTRSQVMEVMGGDIGRNIFFVPLAQRKTQLEQIPWVESASVMRFVPNRLKVEIHERTPVAFARTGSRILLLDDAGTFMELPGKKKYSFPVILGMNAAEPLSTRSARMKIYSELVSQLDSGGAQYSQDLSEVDLSDPDDVKVLASSPQGEVLVHLGSSNYLDRYKVYVTHVEEWRQQFNKLESVDLRYDRQIVVNPDLHGATRQAPISVSAAKVAMAAGVKPAALISRSLALPKPHPATPVIVPVKVPEKVPMKVPAKPAARKGIARRGHSKTVQKKIVQKKVVLKKAKPSAASTTQTAVNSLPSPPPAPAAKANPAAPPKPATDAAKPGKKPSPAIAKGQDHP